MAAGLEGEFQRRHVCQPASGRAMEECSVDEVVFRSGSGDGCWYRVRGLWCDGKFACWCWK